MRTCHCKCGILEQYARDPEVPIFIEERTDKCFVQLSRMTRMRIHFCFLCGGDVKDAEKEPCRCGEVKRWTLIPNSILNFDAFVEQYYLQAGTSKLHMYFCPECGGSLPRSKADDTLFIEASQDEMASIGQMLAGAKTKNEIVSLLGTPDQRIKRSATDLRDERIYGVVPIKESLLYTRFKTVHLCVQESLTGEVRLSFLRKERGRKGVSKGVKP